MNYPQTFLVLFFLLVLGAGLLLAPAPVEAFQPPPPGFRLNAEGDEWIRINPNQVEPRPRAPAGQSAQNENRAPVSAVPAPRDADAPLAIALDRARNAGPQAVRDFVARQPNRNHPLLQAALLDAQNDLQSRTPRAPTANQISRNAGPCAYATIQDAVTAAVNGDTIRVAAGYYTETVDVTAGKIITIEGGYDATCTTLNLSLTRVHGNNTGSVVDVSGASVLALRNLHIVGGNSFGAGVDVLGSSRVTLVNTDVYSNTGSNGGGFYIGSGSVVTYSADSDIYTNTATTGAGAIVYGQLFGFDSSSDVYQNAATIDGGGIAVMGGTAKLDNADVVANSATNRGGGFFVSGGGIITLTNSVFVGETAPCCQSASYGGGIYADASQIFLQGAATSVLNNTATNDGGGIYLTNASRLIVTGGNLGYDTSASAGNDATLGAGLYAISSTVEFTGRIINNIATNSGGGVYATNSAITMTNTTIGGTGANQHNQIGASGLNGAGMYLFNNTHATFTNTVIVSNTLSNPSTGYGGGMYIRQGSVVTMTNSRVEQHFLPAASDGRGAGMYLYDATVTLSNTQVLSNTTNNLAGGARMFGTSVLNILGGSSFINNKALGGVGGAIAATNASDINAANATFQYNSSSSHGGAIYMDAGTLDFDGTWDIRYNTAIGNGGAIAVTGTADADLRVTGGPGESFLAVNSASGSGGALYVTNADTVQLYAASGYRLNLSTNSAGGDGGAIYANGGALFDVYGMIHATSNSAVGNGGVFYLGNGSRVWMDDYFDTAPQLWVNTAANGGAIYASNSPRVECDGVEFGFTSDGNKATGGSGGAIYLSGSTLAADNCTFRNNQAQAGNGGAIAAYTSTLTIDVDYAAPTSAPTRAEERARINVPLATACDPALKQCNSLYSNTAISSTASNGNGGAIYTSVSTLTVNSAYLHRNTAVRGGAIYQEGVGALGNISNTLIYSNTSLVSFGAGIRNAGGAITMTHATIANNVGGAGYSPGAAQSYIYNTIIWGNSVGAFGALTTTSCNIDQAGIAGSATNPLFIAPGAGENYRLPPGSPAVDACATGLSTDLVNRLRPKGARFDMGAFEAEFKIFHLPLILR
ncbi:MAG: hypothetical protein HZC40_15150 [Chloroflexi bacterium]|nr:hypothetical protein [Chloroflexota bacterium]